MWNERYAEPGWAYGTEPNDFLREHAHHLPRPGRVICLAEGEGRNAVFLAAAGWEVLAVDQSDVGLAKARALAAERQVALQTAVLDLARWEPEPASCEGVVAIWAHLPRPVRERVHARVVRALRPGGVYLAEAYSPRQLAHRTGGPQDTELLWEPADLRAELEGLELLRLVELEREVHEGKYHHGTSAVVQVVARKG